MAEGVVQQDDHELSQLIGIGDDRYCRTGELQMLTMCQCAGRSNRLSHDGIQANGNVRRGRNWSIEAGQEEEVVDEAAHALGLAAHIIEGGDRIGLVWKLVPGLRLATEHIGVAPNRGQGRSQLVGRVCEKPALGDKDGFEAVEHGVEGAGEARDFVVGVRLVQPGREIDPTVATGGDVGGGCGHAIDRAQCAACQQPSAHCRSTDADNRAIEQQALEQLDRAIDGFARCCDGDIPAKQIAVGVEVLCVVRRGQNAEVDAVDAFPT